MYKVNHELRRLIQQKFMRANRPVVSIIMPSLNQGEFIEESIKSVFEQPIDEIELIVADGGSGDGTLQVLEQLSSRYGNRLTWFSEADNGTAHAINKALSQTSANIIGWLNSDDLYEKNAISNAIQYFSGHRDTLMIYGHGKHIDEKGNIIGDYPTLTPDTDIGSFKDGCFICQPTVFMRKELLNKVGNLNDELQTAFDYELWIRVFKKYRERIGFINKPSACSRLHNKSKTLSLRKQIAVEAIQILKKHFGTAPGHWLLTYFDEILEHYPYIDTPENLPEEIYELTNWSRGFLDDDEFLLLEKTLKNDARFTLLKQDACINVYSDGWLPPQGLLRVRSSSINWKKIILECKNELPKLTGNIITIATPWGENFIKNIKMPGNFTIEINLPVKYTVPSYWSFIINSKNYFVPDEISSNGDLRKLSFQITNIGLV